MVNRRRAVADDEKILGTPLADRLVLFVGLPSFLLLLGLLLPPLARWALGLGRVLPVRPVFALVGALDRPWEMAINLGICLVVGIGAASAALSESARLTVTGAALRVEARDGSRTIPRADVAAVFLDGKTLVVLDRESRQLVREVHEAPQADLADVLRAHGYPWRAADPYAGLFRRWIPDSPELPAAGNAVLAARQIALRRKSRRDVREMSDALERLGFVVRDDGMRQYWRPLVRQEAGA